MSRLKANIDFDRKGKQLGAVAIPHSVHESAYGSIMMPIACIANGKGPTVLLTGGNHGDEYEGQISLLKLIAALDPQQVKGRIIVVPALNFPAAMAGKRTSPIDEGNLNRVFPGQRDGTVTRMIADYVESVLLPLTDHAIDMHSGGSSLEYLPTAWGRVPDGKQEQARQYLAMRVFDAPYAAAVAAAQDDRTMTAACLRQGVTALSCEIGGGGAVTPATVAIAERGIRNVLAHWGVLQGHKAPKPTVRMMIVNSPDLFLSATGRGLFEPAFTLGDWVKKGDFAGRIHSLEEPDRPARALHFKAGGMVICRRVPTRCAPGDCLAHLAVWMD